MFITNSCSLLVNLLLMSSRAELYVQKNQSAWWNASRCVGFIDVTKVHICRPGGHNIIQQSIYSGHMPMNYLLPCIAKTPDGLTCFFVGPVAGCRKFIYFYFTTQDLTMPLVKPFLLKRVSIKCTETWRTCSKSNHGFLLDFLFNIRYSL